MEKYKWSYCLTNVQYNRLIRIINKIPGLTAYLDINDNPSLIDIVRAFRNYTDSEGITTTGMRINSEVLIKWYDLYQKEYAETHKSNNSYSSFRLDRILTWNPRPQWSSNMKVEEIDYLDHFIPKVPGLSNFLYGEKDKSNLYDLVVYFQMRLNATGVNEPEINFLLETIKERFYRIMDDHQDAIHYVNHSHQINDSELINQFQEQAEKEFYKVNLEKNICSNFINRYINCSNPYIAGEIFLRFFRANKIDIALIFVQKAFTYIFSAPNIYWHNKEAVFGSVNIVYTLIEALGYEGVVKLKESYSNVSKSLLETAYLLLSRTIYWYDKETYKDETYDDLKRPISIQHKLRAYRLRAYLTETFGEFFFPKTNEVERNMMTLADMLSAHEVAYANKIVGRESIFRKDAIKLFHTKGLFKTCSPEQAAEKGFMLSDHASQTIHSQYKSGSYCLTENDISNVIKFLRIYFRNKIIEAEKFNIPISYLKKDNYSPSFKKEKDKIRQYLQSNGIVCLYHFTESDKIDSIIKYGGLLSYKRCLDEDIVMPVREDMALSRDIDAKFGLEDYVRLSFCSHLPKIDERKSEGANLVMLRICIDVALFDETMFTDIEATHNGLKYGNSFEDLKRVNLASTQKEFCEPSDPDFLQRQAEILVRGLIPLKYIINISNPEPIK